jgi:vitamin B12 transporter
MNGRTLALAGLITLIPFRLGAQSGQGQAAAPPRHEVVVTATRLETPERKVGSSLTVITADDLARTGESFVLDALEAVLGLSTAQSGGPGSTAAVYIRGAGSEHTLFLIDGLELNDPINPSRSFDLAHLSLSQVERIEVLRGPQGLLFGSDALGGVVNIITRTGRGRPRFALATSVDTMGTVATDVSLAGSGGKADYSLALFHERTPGISAASSAYPGNVEKDAYRNLGLAVRFGYAVRPTTGLTLAVRATSAGTELDNFGGPGGDDTNSRQDYGSVHVRAQFRDLSRGGRWERTLSLSWLGSRRDHLNPVDAAHPQDSEAGAYRSGLLDLDWQNNFFLARTHTLTAGLELEDERGSSEYVYESAWGGAASSFPTARAGSAGLYLLDHWEYRDRFFVTAGVRADSHSRSGSAVTARVAPSYLVVPTGTRLKASIGSGFKSPSLYQLFAPATAWGPVGNPGLRPERALGFDAGIEQRLAAGRVVLGLTWFGNTFHDLVDFDFQAGYVNIGRAKTKGLEASAEARSAEGFSVRASYTRLSALDEDTGEELLRRPRDKFAADASARLFRRIDIAASVVWVGERLDRDYSVMPSETVTLPGYVLIDVVLAAPLGRGLELFVRADNVLDARYEAVCGYGAPGRAFRTGIRLAL